MPRLEASRRAPTDTVERFSQQVAGSIPTIVRSYKSAVTYRIHLIHTPPSAPVWQRNYYEHIIRNETEWERIRAYVQTNPARWESDQLHP